MSTSTLPITTTNKPKYASNRHRVYGKEKKANTAKREQRRRDIQARMNQIGPDVSKYQQIAKEYDQKIQYLAPKHQTLSTITTYVNQWNNQLAKNEFLLSSEENYTVDLQKVVEEMNYTANEVQRFYGKSLDVSKDYGKVLESNRIADAAYQRWLAQNPSQAVASSSGSSSSSSSQSNGGLISNIWGGIKNIVSSVANKVNTVINNTVNVVSNVGQVVSTVVSSTVNTVVAITTGNTSNNTANVTTTASLAGNWWENVKGAVSGLLEPTATLVAENGNSVVLGNGVSGVATSMSMSNTNIELFNLLNDYNQTKTSILYSDEYIQKTILAIVAYYNTNQNKLTSSEILLVKNAIEHFNTNHANRIFAKKNPSDTISATAGFWAKVKASTKEEWQAGIQMEYNARRKQENSNAVFAPFYDIDRIGGGAKATFAPLSALTKEALAPVMTFLGEQPGGIALKGLLERDGAQFVVRKTSEVIENTPGLNGAVTIVALAGQLEGYQAIYKGGRVFLKSNKYADEVVEIRTTTDVGSGVISDFSRVNTFNDIRNIVKNGKPYQNIAKYDEPITYGGINPEYKGKKVLETTMYPDELGFDAPQAIQNGTTKKGFYRINESKDEMSQFLEKYKELSKKCDFDKKVYAINAKGEKVETAVGEVVMAIKYDGEIVMTPRLDVTKNTAGELVTGFGNYEYIPHPMLTGGEPAPFFGTIKPEFDPVTGELKKFVLRNYSGHTQPGADALDLAKKVFIKLGYPVDVIPY